MKICSVMGQLTEEVDSELQLTDQYSNSLISDPRDTLNQDHLRLSNRKIWFKPDICPMSGDKQTIFFNIYCVKTRDFS